MFEDNTVYKPSPKIYTCHWYRQPSSTNLPKTHSAILQLLLHIHSDHQSLRCRSQREGMTAEDLHKYATRFELCAFFVFPYIKYETI